MQDDTIFIIFAELRRFDKELQDEIFRRLLEACDIPRFSEVKRNKYDKDMYDERRRNGELATAREIGMKEGMEKGIEKGVVSVARQMKQMGLPADTIAEATGLSFKDIESL